VAWLNTNFSFLTAYDFLNLGLSGGELALLYAGVLVVLLLLIIIIVRIANRKKRQLKRWRKNRPATTELSLHWTIADDERRNEIGELAKEENWCAALIPELGASEQAERLFRAFWPYQAEKQAELLPLLVQAIADQKLEQSLAATSALKDLADERALPLLLVALLDSENYPPARICEILPVYEKISARVLTAMYKELSAEEAEKRELLISAMGALGEFMPRRFLFTLMAEGDPKIAAAAERALKLGGAAQEEASDE